MSVLSHAVLSFPMTGLRQEGRGHLAYLCSQCSLWADSRLAPSQWETSLQSNAVSHWLVANLESSLAFSPHVSVDHPTLPVPGKTLLTPTHRPHRHNIIAGREFSTSVYNVTLNSRESSCQIKFSVSSVRVEIQMPGKEWVTSELEGDKGMGLTKLKEDIVLVNVRLCVCPIWGFPASSEKVFLQLTINFAYLLIGWVFRNDSIFSPWPNILLPGGLKMCQTWDFQALTEFTELTGLGWEFPVSVAAESGDLWSGAP